MQTLTKRQADVLAFIKAYTADHGYAPSYAEITDGIGLSSKSRSTCFNLVARLVERGVLQKTPGRARSFELKTGDAEFILRDILAWFDSRNCLWHDDPCVKRARLFIQGRSQ